MQGMYRSFDAETSQLDVYRVCIDVFVPKQVNRMFTGYVLSVAAKTSQHDVCVDLSIPKQVNIKIRGYVSTFWCQSK